MVKNLESDLQDKVKQLLTKKRVFHFRFQAQSNLNGLPDIICLYKGFFLGLELKRPNKGAPTDLQLRKLKSIIDNGGIGILVEYVEQVDNLLNCIDENSRFSAESILTIYNRRCNEKK